MAINEITRSDLTRAGRLKTGAIAAPVLLTLVPAVITLVLLLAIAGGPSSAVLLLFGGAIATLVGLITGLVTAGVLAKRRADLIKEVRERMASRGIRADEVEWFRKELKNEERRALKSLERGDPLLADAYRETLASRLTASRMIRSSRRELMSSKRRQNSIDQLKSGRAKEFRSIIGEDIKKLESIQEEAQVMLAESESRLRMIEAAGARQGSIADSELALKKLSSRTAELPLALESAKIAEEIRLELEKEGIE